MGQCIEKKIIQTKEYIDPSVTPSIPDLNFNLIYPKTIYDAVYSSMDENSNTLTDEIANIYRMIDQRQPQISGKSGNLLSFGSAEGSIVETEIVQSIEVNPNTRSSVKVPSEKAVGDMVDKACTSGVVGAHIKDDRIHLSEEDRMKLDNVVSADELNDHIDNENVHVTAEDKDRWNNMIDPESFSNHTLNKSNPHNVTAHQVGTYTRKEIDAIIAAIRESYFNHKNINYDNRTGTAVLEEYNDNNWNPNYILSFGDSFPTVIDETLTYFALRPATDYSADETQECMIFIKRPSDDTWVQIGSQLMDQGDMVLQYPDTNMYAWLGGRFVPMFDMDNSTSSGGSSDLMWRPMIYKNEETGLYQLGWTRSSETYAPAEVVISGPPGYTPIKNVDYFDGAPGIGIPPGGNIGDILVKSTPDDFETEWKSPSEAGAGGAASSVAWKNVIGRPDIYNERGYSSDGVMTQKSVTDIIDTIELNIIKLKELVGDDGFDVLKKMITDHTDNKQNPHNVTPELIGAATSVDLLKHLQDTNNPHSVTKAQVGLSNVDNTADKDKPISRDTQLAIDNINSIIKGINDSLNEGNMVSNVSWIPETCTLVFQFRNTSTPTLQIHIPIIEIFQSIVYDGKENDLVMILPDGTESRVSLEALVYNGYTSTTIKSDTSNNSILCEIIPKSITGEHLVDNINIPGKPTTTTVDVTDKSDTIATTAFVKSVVIDNVESDNTDMPLSANMGKHLNEVKADMSKVEEMIKDSPALTVIDNLLSDKSEFALSANMGKLLNETKATKVHTDRSGSTYGKSTVDLFGHSRASSVEPTMNGNQFIGDDDGTYARGNHVHPTDTSRAPAVFSETDILRGNPKAETPDSTSKDNSIATTEWVKNLYPMMNYQDIVDAVAYAYLITHR